MSAPKTAAAKAATRPLGGRAPESAKRTHPKKNAKLAPTKSARGKINEMSGAAEKLAADIGRALAQGRSDVLTLEAIQALMAAACRSYSAQVEARGDFPPLAADSPVNSNAVMITTRGVREAAYLAGFGS